MSALLESNKKLFLVKCRGMHGSLALPGHGTAFVIAYDAGEAYQKVRADLDKRDLWFGAERELQTVELCAEVGDYPPCGTALYL